MTDTPNTKGGPDENDKLVGRRIREKRIVRGWSQEFLAHRLGVTFQQLQKYEKGVNRVASGRLYQLAGLFGCTADAFFDWPDRKGVDVIEFHWQADKDGHLVMVQPNMTLVWTGGQRGALYRISLERLNKDGEK